MKDELGELGVCCLKGKDIRLQKDRQISGGKALQSYKNCVVAEGLTFDDYKTCLFDGKTIFREQMLFQDKKHEVHTVNKGPYIKYVGGEGGGRKFLWVP